MRSRSPLRRRAYWPVRPRVFFEEALETCGRLAGIEGLAGELKTRLRVSGKALFLPLRAALTGRIDGPDLRISSP
jgi:nondiscriminating glutamyl-tRNA synthetase